MNNKKGFTLIELLAMLVVLGIFMTVAIPNITGMITNQKNNTIKADATNFVDKAKIYFSKNPKERPPATKCVIFSLNYLDNNGDIKKGPNGGEYDPYESLVIVKRTGGEYKYYVRLIENISENKNFGIVLEPFESINTKSKSFIKGNIEKIGLDSNKDGNDSKINNYEKIKNVCDSVDKPIEKYYN